MQSKQKKPPEFTKQFIRKGAVVLLKVDVADTELNSKEILTLIQSENGVLDKQKANIGLFEQQIETATSNIEKTKENIEAIELNIKKIEKHKDFAMEVQLSKLKNLVAEVSPKMEEKVRTEYKYDDSMTEQENRIHMMAQFREWICRDEKIAENISVSVIQDTLRNPDYLNNPFIANPKEPEKPEEPKPRDEPAALDVVTNTSTGN